VFYQRLFPFKDFYKWLSYGNSKCYLLKTVNKHYFLNREFSFTLASDTYIRFKSFNNDMDLKNEIVRLCPVKIDIGAVYNYPVILNF
jgi:DNA primase small subunit